MPWLAFSLSAVAVSVWLCLSKQVTTKADYFLFACRIFGYVYASLLLDEPFTVYTFCGLVVVLAALGLGQQKTRKWFPHISKTCKLFWLWSRVRGKRPAQELRPLLIM